MANIRESLEEYLSELDEAVVSISVTRNPKAQVRYSVSVDGDTAQFCDTLDDVLSCIGVEIESELALQAMIRREVAAAAARRVQAAGEAALAAELKRELS